MWPVAVAAKLAPAFFWFSGLGIALLWIRNPWLTLLTTFFFTQFVCIYWSFFPSASHGANLPLLALWLLAVHRFDRKQRDDAFVFAIQILVAITLASAASFKWRNSGFYWTDGLEMQRRIFSSYAVDGRRPFLFVDMLMNSTALSRAAGVVELLSQTAILPLVLLSAFWSRLRYVSGAAAVIAVAGINVGMQLFFYQFIPLALALFVPLQSFSLRPSGTPMVWLMIAVLGFDAFVSFKHWGWMRNVFPVASNPMFSKSGYPEFVQRLRHPQPQDLDFVQREFFILFAGRNLTDDVRQIAIAHGLDPDQLQRCSFNIEMFRDDIDSMRRCPR